MTPKRLSNAEMFGINQEWRGPLRGRLLAWIPLAWLVGRMDEAHTLFTTPWQAPPPDPVLKDLRVKAAGLDVDHDDHLRTGLSIAEGLAARAEKRRKGAGKAWFDLIDVLWPMRLLHNNRTFFEQGAHTVAVAEWLNGQPEVRRLIDSVVLPEGDTLGQIIDDWLAAGVALFQVETQSQDRIRELATTETAASPLVRARSLFTQTYNQIQNHFRDNPEAPADLRDALLSRVERLITQADTTRRPAPDVLADPQPAEGAPG